MRTHILSFLFLLTFVISCTTNDMETIQEKTTSYDVYVGGVDEFNACYWKNGQKVSLAGGENLQGTYIAVENNNVYMLANNIGSLGGSNTIPAWYFWKNGVKYNVAQYLNVTPNTINEPNNFQLYNNLTIKNGDIYFNGIMKNPTPTSTTDQYLFCSWKNGVRTVLETSETAASLTLGAYGFFNNDVYISKRYYGTPGNWTNWEVGYYKNNVYHFLTNSLIPRKFLSDNSVLYLSLVDMNGNFYLKNILTNTDVTVPTNISQSGITDFSWDGSDIYYIGKNFYFKNNNQVQISDPNNFNNIGHFIAKDQNIYMTRTNTNGTAVKFFINNTEIMSLPDTSRGCFNSVVVVPN
ncbi:hypothetical protein [Chryseobacterium sp. MMS23-Vi53]|uniref:hypothetical protein n=1 Tax=Chryseobacterium sp. MMS23-Vi53 TaxID=3386644 RepID=UPI0039EB0DDE